MLKGNINLPNAVTFLRILCIPLVLIFLNLETPKGNILAGLIFCFAFVTDALDGFLARRYDWVTNLGKFLDPLADKILVSVTMIMLVHLNRIPVWMVILIIGREIAVTGLRSISASEGLYIQASGMGKYKTLFQASAIAGICIHDEYGGIDFQTIGMILLWIALILTLISGIKYFLRFYHVIIPGRS